MIPDITDTRWEQLVTGGIAHQFKSTPAGMCVSRNVRRLAGDGSAETRQKAVSEVHAFFSKYAHILGEDIQAVFG
ncbi:hypothetical protein [Spirochaeta dissipatitropha]